MSQPTFEMKPLVWFCNRVINGCSITIMIRDHGPYVAWTLHYDDGFELELSKAGTHITLLDAKDEVFTYAEYFLHL